MDQIGLDLIRLDQIGKIIRKLIEPLEIGLDWIRLDWIRLDQTGSDWIKLVQIGSNWIQIRSNWKKKISIHLPVKLVAVGFQLDIPE